MSNPSPTHSLAAWKSAEYEKFKRKAKEGAPYIGCPDGRPHHWMLPEAQGRYGLGVCKLCGKEKEFENYEPIGWGYETTVQFAKESA